jgi:CHAT domain-containing protein
LLANWLTGSTIVLDLDGPISTIPFEALQNNEGIWLADQFTFVRSPGFFPLSRQQRDMPASPALYRVLAVGNPRLSPDESARFGALPEASEEARAVASNFRQSVLLLDNQATASAILPELPRTNIFHFAGHALVTPERSGLLLGRDGVDTPPQLWAASGLPSDSMHQCLLVVLSACSSGDLKYLGLNRPENLVRRFLMAGAVQVVASRAVVDSKITEILMSAFYAALMQGASPTAALANSTRLIRHTAIYTHPAYWASFCIFGQDDSHAISKRQTI